ncbi:MAG TPA: type II secretion system minor pseudopilin GspK [Gammaproteobacteria bacterium]|nr:type II secretion system minor pseudopilin GspK [Gammaproteobacteria bacterium]
MASPERQRGVALITALVVMAIATAIAAAMYWRNALATRRTAAVVQGDQAMEYALGAEGWAEQILARDAKKKHGVTSLDQDWAQQLPPLPVDGGQIQGKLEDLQGRFNINNVTAAGGVRQFQLLLQALGQDPNLAQAVAAWIQAGNGMANANDDNYTRLQPPYITGQHAMESITELQLVTGFTPAVYAQVAPYVCALPAPTSVNINTASIPVIESLNENITADVASQVIGERGSAPLTTSPDALKPFNIPNPNFDSSYFLLTVVAQIGSTHVTLYSLLKRDGAGQVTAIRRTFGTL